MDTIETLMNEHRLIEAVIDALAGFADEIRRREATEREELARFVTFLREFADGCHHGKEEGVLFAAMVEHGFPANGGPIAVMLHEHDQGRQLIGALAAAVEQPGPWTAGNRQAISDAAHGYAALLHAHIHKEDAILYPMAEQHVPPEAMKRVGEACERFEAEGTGEGAHARLHALAEELIARHAPVRSPAAPSDLRAGGAAPAHRPHGCC